MGWLCLGALTACSRSKAGVCVRCKKVTFIFLFLKTSWNVQIEGNVEIKCIKNVKQFLQLRNQPLAEFSILLYSVFPSRSTSWQVTHVQKAVVGSTLAIKFDMSLQIAAIIFVWINFQITQEKTQTWWWHGRYITPGFPFQMDFFLSDIYNVPFFLQMLKVVSQFSTLVSSPWQYIFFKLCWSCQ